MAPTTSTLLNTAHTLIAAYDSWSLPALLAIRSPTCTNQILPSSLHFPPVNNDRYLKFFQRGMSRYRNFTLTVHDTVVDETARKVAMHITSTADTDVGPYANDYMLVLHMTEDGGRVERFVEFADSKYSEEFLGRLEEHARRREREGVKL